MSSDVKLPGSARQDVGRLCLVAVLSSGFFATPLILAEDPVLPVPAALRATAPSVTVVTTEVSAPVFVPELAGPAGIVRIGTRSTPRPHRAVPFSRASAAAAAPPRTQLRRLGRWIAGDGRYTVRPFPTINQD